MKTIAPELLSVLKDSKMVSRLKAGKATISDDLATLGNLPDDPINESCFTVFTNDVASSAPNELELRQFTDLVVGQMAATHDKLNIGAPMLRKMAAQAHRRIPFLPSRGTTKGKDRNFFNMIYYKVVNREYVRASEWRERTREIRERE